VYFHGDADFLTLAVAEKRIYFWAYGCSREDSDECYRLIETLAMMRGRLIYALTSNAIFG